MSYCIDRSEVISLSHREVSGRSVADFSQNKNFTKKGQNKNKNKNLYDTTKLNVSICTVFGKYISEVYLKMETEKKTFVRSRQEKEMCTGATLV